MKHEVIYSIGPTGRPSEFENVAGPDMTAAFAAGRRRWPDEPLFCREQGSYLSSSHSLSGQWSNHNGSSL
jgi:hypothetical protein